MLLKPAFRIGLGLVGLGAIAALVIGPDSVNLLRTLRRQAQQTVRDNIDPQVKLEQAAARVEEELPKQIAQLKGSAADLARELEVQLAAQDADQAAAGLREADLRKLAAAIQKGESVELRGRNLTFDAARDEAARLLKRHKECAATIETRKALIAGLKQRQAQTEAAIAQAYAAARDFSAHKQDAAAKIALLSAAQRLQSNIGGGDAIAVPQAMAELGRDLDRRLIEAQEKARLKDATTAQVDEYEHAAIQKKVEDELKGMFPQATAPEAAK